MHSGLLHGYDLAQLKAKLAQEPFASHWRAMRTQVRALAAADRKTDVIASGGWCHSCYFTPAVLEAGLVARLTGDAEALAHVQRQVEKLARVYANPPHSFDREIPARKGAKPTAYFSNAHTCLALSACAPLLPDAFWERFLVLVRERLLPDHHDPEYFFTHFNAGHNAVTTHIVAAAICALVYGQASGYDQAEQLVTWGRDACEQHVEWAYDEQGAPHEGPMYAQVTLEWVFLYADLLRRHGREDLFATLPKLRRIAQALVELQLPGTGGILGFDDCRDWISRHRMSWLLLAAAQYEQPVYLALWQQTRQQSARQVAGESPVDLNALELLWWNGRSTDTTLLAAGLPTAFVGRGKGVAMYRSSWAADASCAMVLGQGRSHNVPDHTHADAGHVSLFCRGELLAYDTGYFNFDEDTHSVVLVDGEPRQRTLHGNLYSGQFAAAGRHRLVDYVVVDATAARGVMWAQRTVLFIRCGPRDAYLVMLDNINVDNGVHRFCWQLQAHPETAIGSQPQASRACVRGARGRIDCHFFSPTPDDFPGAAHTLELAAVQRRHRDPKTGDAAWNPCLTATQTGPNCTLASVLIMRGTEEPDWEVSCRPAYRTFDLSVAHGDVVDQVALACDHSYIRLPDLWASAQIVVVRRSRSGEVIDFWSLGDRPARPLPRAAAPLTAPANRDAMDP